MFDDISCTFLTKNDPLSQASLFGNWSWGINSIGSNTYTDLWTNWHVEAGQPNYDGNCARVLGYDYGALGQWYDGNCHEYNYVICEKSAGYYPSITASTWSRISENIKSRFLNHYSRILARKGICFDF